MNILVVGIGSIGARHTANLLLLGYRQITLVSSKQSLDEKLQHLEKHHTLEEALLDKTYDTAIVCTPTSSHVNVTNRLLNSGIQNIYLEKPVSHSIEGVEALLELAQLKNARLVIGYDLRFDPGLQKVQELLIQEEYGRPLSVNAVVGQYLPDWRPHEDYTKGTSASKASGGGVLLDLVHEFDYLYWLFGDVQYVAANYATGQALKIETEESADVLLRFNAGVSGSVHMDYLQPKLVRYCMITCTRGTIWWDMTSREVECIDDQKKTDLFSYKTFERNDRFLLIMKTFLEDATDNRLATLQEGIQSLKIALAAKQSGQCNMFIQPSSLAV